MNEALSRTPVSSVRVTPSVSLSAFAGLALIAACLAQALAPALPGSATGIAGLINLTSFAAACTSQLVAAGGIVLCLRLLGGLLPKPHLGVAFRIVIVPATLSVIGFTVASAARPIAPELGRVVAVAAIVAIASAVPLLWSSARTRGVSVILLVLVLGAISDLAAYELTQRLGFLEASAGSLGSTLAGLGLCLDVGAALGGFVWAAQQRRRIAIGLAIVLLSIGLAVLLGQAGARQSASSALVVLHRSLSAIADRSLLAFPAGLSHGLSLALLMLTAGLLCVPGRKSELRAALALCVLGRTATGAPAAALLSVGAALTALGAFVEFEAPPFLPSSKRAQGG